MNLRKIFIMFSHGAVLCAGFYWASKEEFAIIKKQAIIAQWKQHKTETGHPIEESIARLLDNINYTYGRLEFQTYHNIKPPVDNTNNFKGSAQLVTTVAHLIGLS